MSPHDEAHAQGTRAAVWIPSACLAAAAFMAGHAPPQPGVLNGLLALAIFGLVWFLLGWEGALVQRQRDLRAAAQERDAAAHASHAAPTIRWPLILAGGFAGYGLLQGLIALFQFLAPDAARLAEGFLVAQPLGSRVGGNLHQPNHLATVLVWAAAGWVALAAGGLMRLPLAWVGMVTAMMALVATGSRTGALALLFLVAWGVADRRLDRGHRVMLVASPLVYALASWVLGSWGPQADAVSQTAQRLSFSGGMSAEGRLAGWRNTLDLIQAEPWLGVGWGNFHRAWMLTPLADRNGELFTNPHNLLLTLMVEWGVPLGLLMAAFLLALVWKATRRAWGDTGPAGPMRRAAALMLWIVGLHSLLEYPLWYLHLALPTAMALWVAWGFDFRPLKASEGQTLGATVLGMGLMVVASLLWWDYQKVTVLYGDSYGRYQFHHNLESMRKGQDAWFYGRFGDRVVIHSVRPQPGQDWSPELQRAFDRGMRDVMYPQLMRRWAEAYAARGRPGDLDRARHIARRVWEMRITQGASWFEPCRRALNGETVNPLPFQCEEPQVRLTWRDFEEDQ